MIRVFSEKREPAAEEVTHTGNGHDTNGQNGQNGTGRLAEGFELLFGEHLREHLERAEAGIMDRLARLETEAARQADVVEELIDKARATLQREEDEYRRRRAVEAEIHQALTDARAGSTESTAELRARAERIEQRLEEDLEAVRELQRGFHLESRERLDDVREQLSRLESAKVERTQLAVLLSNAAREFSWTTPAQTPTPQE